MYEKSQKKRDFSAKTYKGNTSQKLIIVYMQYVEIKKIEQKLLQMTK